MTDHEPVCECCKQVDDATEVFRLVREFFAGEPDKALTWMVTANPLFGDIAPLELIRLGRAKILRQIVEEQLAENVRPKASEATPEEDELVKVKEKLWSRLEPVVKACIDINKKRQR